MNGLRSIGASLARLLGTVPGLIPCRRTSALTLSSLLAVSLDGLPQCVGAPVENLTDCAALQM